MDVGSAAATPDGEDGAGRELVERTLVLFRGVLIVTRNSRKERFDVQLVIYCTTLIILV